MWETVSRRRILLFLQSNHMPVRGKEKKYLDRGSTRSSSTTISKYGFHKTFVVTKSIIPELCNFTEFLNFCNKNFMKCISGVIFDLVLSPKKLVFKANMSYFWRHDFYLFSSAFSFACGIAQCKYDWSFVKGGHVLDNFFRENTTDSGSTNQYTGFQLFDDISQFFHRFMGMCEWHFVFGKTLISRKK